MTSQSVVRQAVADDREEVWRLFRLLWAENAMFPISDAKVDYHIHRFLNPDKIAADDLGTRGIIGVIGKVGSLEGAIMLSFGTPWYSETITIDEYLNFVDPKHRVSNHAKALIGYAKNVVDNLRSDHPDLRLVIGVLSTIRTAAKIRMYERLLVPCGAFFMHPPPAIVESRNNQYSKSRGGSRHKAS
jgi:hypothetical protein